MASISFLQNCPRDQITFEMIESLLSQNILEGLTIEYKEKGSSSLIDTIAAFANTHGGLILVGVKDQIGPNRMVGVDDQEMTKISSLCSDLLDPPFVPEIIDLKFPSDHSKFLLLIRVFSETSTRPVVTRGKVLVRYPGRNDGADQSRIRQLFSEVKSPATSLNSYIPMPNMQTEALLPDLIVRSGLILPVNLSSSGRPFSESTVAKLISQLGGSAINANLTRHMSDLGLSAFQNFHKNGLNRARHLRLVWSALDPSSFQSPAPVECVFTFDSGLNGIEPPTSMTITVDLILRHSAHLIRNNPSQFLPGMNMQISLPTIYETIKAILKTLIADEFVNLVAEICDLDIGAVPRPMSMHLFMPHGVNNTINRTGLRVIPNSGPSSGAQLIGDAVLDLQDKGNLNHQVDQWVNQLALDGGLDGMERLISEYHRLNP